MISFFKIVLIVFVFLMFSGKSVAAPEEYQKWVKDLRREMLQKGIDAALFDEIYSVSYYEKKPAVVKKDRHQTEFVLTTSEYLNRVVNSGRVKKARKEYKNLSENTDFDKKLDVPLNYLVAFWGVETNFGKHQGNHNWIKSLTQLAYDGRRADFFQNELFYALKIIQDNKLNYKKIQSSWAGAVGNFQFMPSTYAHYAIDYNDNGKADLWNERGDAFASAANYLKKSGWKKNKPWGKEIELPWNFDYSQAGKHNRKKLSEWKALGIDVNVTKDTQDDMAYVLLTEGKRGPAYLVFDNFNVIMKWNHSVNYALAVGLLADYISSDKKWQKVEDESYKPTKEDIKKIQQVYNKNFKQNINIDGRLGTQTTTAIKRLQKEYGLVQDGYPDWRLIKRVTDEKKYKNYVPLPPKKKSKH